MSAERGPISSPWTYSDFFYVKHHVVVLKLLQKFEADILFPDELWLSETQAHTCMRLYRCLHLLCRYTGIIGDGSYACYLFMHIIP